MTWSIYTLADPRTGAVRYVGATCAPETRLDSHMADARRCRRGRRRPPHTPKQAWLVELDRLGLTPALVVIDTYPERPEAPASTTIEHQWIRAFLDEGADLTNIHGDPVAHLRSVAAGWKNRRESARRWAARPSAHAGAAR